LQLLPRWRLLVMQTVRNGMMSIRCPVRGWRSATGAITAAACIAAARGRSRLEIEAMSRPKCAHELGKRVVNARHLSLQIPNPLHSLFGRRDIADRFLKKTIITSMSASFAWWAVCAFTAHLLLAASIAGTRYSIQSSWSVFVSDSSCLSSRGGGGSRSSRRLSLRLVLGG
jgi:hypothetical protein